MSYHTGRYMSDAYEGRAIRASHPQYDDNDVLGSIGLPIVQVVYIVPFCLVFVVLIIVIVVVYVGGHDPNDHDPNDHDPNDHDPNDHDPNDHDPNDHDPNDHDPNDHDPNDHDPNDHDTNDSNDQMKQKLHNTWKKYKNALCNKLQMQANLAAISLICCYFTIYTFTLDIVSVVVENNMNLPKYFERMSYGLYVITIVCTVVSLLFNLIGIIWFLVVMCHNCCRKEKWEVYIPMIFCIGSTLLSMSFHFQNILIAWSTDPFYASRISLLHGIIIFSYFISFKYAYIAPIKITRRNEDSKNPNHWSTRELIILAISLSITTVVCTSITIIVSLFVAHVPTNRSNITIIVSLFVAHVPTNRSLEQSITGIGTMYNGGVILVGGLIAYSMGMQYFGNGFSLEMALKKAMKGIKNAPFNPDDNGTWQQLTEEGRMTEVMKALINRQACLARQETP